jgi:hypothetical protein
MVSNKPNALDLIQPEITANSISLGFLTSLFAVGFSISTPNLNIPVQMECPFLSQDCSRLTNNRCQLILIAVKKPPCAWYEFCAILAQPAGLRLPMSFRALTGALLSKSGNIF